jgi:hypothetical protein
MGKGTNFDPDILEDAYKELAKIPTTLSASRSMRNIGQASSIREDVSAMDDKLGGWSFLGDQVSTTAEAVQNYVTQLTQLAAKVHDAMRASIDTLTGADTDSRTDVTNAGPTQTGTSTDPKGRG